ncbi:hypothetical protein THAOC_16137 [Thalassiosira oceanica]|uniref:Uncharacterized protein n=1 Tax=Thalassiosira oceanica TaxID=159749 RepID=K0SYG1_THAOC|nr:hypothetical protein THAOC_16137 [Thalassiosira oceanica]|eukprot:EJK63222.1 hypothetical protein THAOC_16137 [Thalassiosira oceanica]
MVECSFNSVEKCLFTYVRLLHKELTVASDGFVDGYKPPAVSLLGTLPSTNRSDTCSCGRWAGTQKSSLKAWDDIDTTSTCQFRPTALPVLVISHRVRLLQRKKGLRQEQKTEELMKNDLIFVRLERG